jgi:hypothetical protein
LPYFSANAQEKGFQPNLRYDPDDDTTFTLELLMTPCFGQNRQIDIILRALFAAEWKMKFAQAWVIEFEQRSKGSATGSVGLDRIAAAIRVVYCPYP